MAESFRPLFEAMKKIDAALHAQDEHEDLRETVLRLEGLVMQLSTDVRALRDERRNNGTS